MQELLGNRCPVCGEVAGKRRVRRNAAVTSRNRLDASSRRHARVRSRAHRLRAPAVRGSSGALSQGGTWAETLVMVQALRRRGLIDGGRRAGRERGNGDDRDRGGEDDRKAAAWTRVADHE